ncbi:hypothetical protein BKA61DRAFT_579832 [Leptodontidium sp. MPI-SDFR-AT-0119]|nr:hypothetical protein BKA61DRAFT_579832 [Leptodontidium sp. MPI-SDFR-AT-0119]
MALIPLPSLEAAEQLREDLQNLTYITRQERLKDLPPFLRTDLSFDLVTQAYRTISQPRAVWQPGEIDDTMDKVAYLTAVIYKRVFRPSALFDLYNQFNHSNTDLEILPYFKLQPHEKIELETRIERAAYCAS